MKGVALFGQAKAEVGGALGLYVHVPFCASTCGFCAFYQDSPTRQAVEGFMEGVARELLIAGSHGPISTVFWGGGTPGLLSPKDLDRLSGLVRAHLDPSLKEWTIELAPASVTEERLAVLRTAGVTRVSLGVQSFREDLLKALDREHTPAQVYRAYDRIRAAGFASVNIDLMFALPGQDRADWQSDLNEAVRLAPDHLSTYCLTFEEDTALWVKLSQGKVKLDPENEARMYEQTWEHLAGLGYDQYEVSNFARPGHACLHNLNTWRMNEWLGIGPSAASQYQGWRGANEPDLDAWRASLSRGERMTQDRLAVTADLLAEDAVVFGLRMNEGVDLAPWQARSPRAPWTEIERLLARLQQEGFAFRAGSKVRLTAKGRLVADSVGSEIMAAFDRPASLPR